jgi:hypothetical protein
MTSELGPNNLQEQLELSNWRILSTKRRQEEDRGTRLMKLREAAALFLDFCYCLFLILFSQVIMIFV